VLDGACQLWLISDRTGRLGKEHVEALREFFDSGRGLYIWGDNEPYYHDANCVAHAVFGSGMRGDTRGDKTVTLQKEPGAPGFVSHLITTGLEYLYEGVTIASIDANPQLKPLIYGSAKNVVVALYDADGKRAIIDGGFTRLFVKWDTAGTGRYVANAAGWLANFERFGKKTLGLASAKR
jgi:hypothetical protein